VRCLAVVGLVATLVISAVAITAGQACQEETSGEVVVRLDSQQRGRVRARDRRAIDDGHGRPLVASTGRDHRELPAAAPPAFLHLIGSGIKLLL
jgi:hypothetical protein